VSVTFVLVKLASTRGLSEIIYRIETMEL